MSAHDFDSEAGPELPADIRQGLTRYKAPPGLERRVRHMVAGQDARRTGWLERMGESWLRWVPVGAAFACGVLVSAGVLTWRGGPGGIDAEDEVVASHVRSLMAGHVTDVASSDRHTVKPWFTGKVDFAPPVVDLASEGFPLAGGRLEYIQGRPAVALVYRRGGHTINVFVLPADSRAHVTSFDVRQGFQVAEWQAKGMRFWAVSDIARDEMSQFAAALASAI